MDTASIVVALFVIDSLLFMLIFALGYFFYSRLGQIAMNIEALRGASAQVSSSNAIVFQGIVNDLQAIRAPVASLCELSVNTIDEIRSVDSRVNSLLDRNYEKLCDLYNYTLSDDTRFNPIKSSLQEFINSQYETNRDIINLMQSVDSRVARHVELLQGFPPDDDELPVLEQPDLTDLATSLYQVRGIVEAFKNDLITQVRLSREDYEELMATAESKEGRLIEQLVSLRAQLTDFRNRFDEFTR